MEITNKNNICIFKQSLTNTFLHSLTHFAKTEELICSNQYYR